MNEQEAIEQFSGEYLVSMTGKETPARVRYHNEALDTAIAALKEVQEYHAIGLTPKMVRGLISGYNKMEQKCRNYKMVEMIRCQGLYDTAKLLEELKKYQAIGTPEQCQEAVERTRWIPVNERMPEDEKEVLVWFEYFQYGYYNRLHQTYGLGYAENGEWSHFVNGTSGWKDLNIIAWMPLPEPYHIGEKVGDGE